jgi:hypothetical protein
MSHLAYSTFKGHDVICLRGPATRGVIEMLVALQLEVGSAFILDLTKADFTQVDSVSIGSIAQRSRSVTRPDRDFRLALVADAPVSYGLCRMLQLQLDENENRIAVRGTVAAAAEWLQASDILAVA